MKKKFEIEEFVNENYDLFNSEEPKEGHFERFKSKLPEEKVNKNIFKLSLKYAAVIIIVISGFFIYENISDSNNSQIISEIDNETNEEFYQITNYYDSQLDNKEAELAKITCESEDSQKQIIKNDLNELNEEFSELKNDYKSNPDNEIIKNSLINNYRMRIDILDMIITTLKNYC